MKFLVAAGGTGGHFYPGLAVARSLVSSGHDVKFIVRDGDYVLPLLEREKIPYVTMSAAGFQRRLALSNSVAVLKIAAGMVQAVGILRRTRPDAVLVMGGYLSFAPAVAARLSGVPVVLHEQNAVPGLANRLISRLVDRIAVSFEESRAVFGPKAVLTGNPVRAEFRHLPDRKESLARWGLDPAKKTVLIFGGSLGAQRLNSLVVEALPSLGPHAGRWQFLHFTGAADEARVKEAYGRFLFGRHVEGYCHEMPAAFSAADLVVSRAGASTLSELIAVRRPALLVPYPLATGQHQSKNARALSSVGAAILREQRDLEASGLAGDLESLLSDAGALSRMTLAYAKVPTDPFAAAERIRDLVISAARR